MVKIKAMPVNLNIIQVNAPTTDHADEVMDEFYETIEQAKIRCRNHEVTIIMVFVEFRCVKF